MLTKIEKSKIYRIFEVVPGLLTWTVITSPIWLGLIAPNLVTIFLTFLAIYWVYLALVHSVGVAVGYDRYKRETGMDWFKKCEDLDFSTLPEKETLPNSLNDVKHLILIPTVDESFEILNQTFQSLAAQNYKFKENLFIAISCEERGAKDVERSVGLLEERYKTQLPNVFFYIHPAGIPGELVGGGAPNRTWGAKHAIGDLKKRGINTGDVIFSTFDADTTLHREFIARLTHCYLTTDKRDNHFYSTAVFLFDNNIWNVHTLMRIEANSVTLGTLSSWTINSDTKETFSCYSVSLNTLIAADFWDASLIDDTVFYWRAFFARKGNFKPRIFYIPNSSDAVHGDTFWKAHLSLYKQLLRWGWGSVTTPLAFQGLLGNKDIPFTTKLTWAYNKAERHIIFRTMVFLITFGFALLTLVNQDVRQTTVAYRLPDIMSGILTVGLVFLIPSTILRQRLTKPVPGNWPIWKKLMVLLEGPLVIINLLTFSLIPFLEAETKMMLGRRYKNLHFTPKYR
ncbi:glycosyltransferase family 2 protein [candidate division WWE3 bacterium]|nr:glycosyltransferase family 2 protein [candidate division WWE3 bacterium]